jgi:hypothetical protein
MGAAAGSAPGTPRTRQEQETDMPAKRTTHRSSKGTKLYAVRAKDGTFKDIQTYKRAHAADLRASAKDETSAKSVAANAKKTVKKATGEAVSAVEGLLAKAKKAVKSAVKKATGTSAAKKPAAKKPAAAKSAAAKPAARKAAPKKAAAKKPAAK